jgi:hypothetical protein
MPERHMDAGAPICGQIGATEERGSVPSGATRRPKTCF